MPASSVQKALRVLLGLCLLTGSTTVSVEHSHERGHLPHSHGFGLVRAAAVRAATAEAGPVARSHCHIVVLGVEFYGDESPVKPSPPEARLALGLATETANDLVSPSPSEPCPVAACPAVPADVIVPEPTGRPIPQLAPAPRGELCDCARGERSGVNLT